MAWFSKFGWWGKKAVDQAVGITSGAVPAPILDSPKVFRLVILVGLVALGVSGWLVWNSIFDATKIKLVVKSNTNTTPIAVIEGLRNKDTDGDGLSDYNELYALKTSPYLSDSDSDGLSDGKEVNDSTNPNCPKGKTCTSFDYSSAATDQTGQLTPQFLRQALLTSGVPQSTIDQLNDTELLQVYQRATNSVETNSNIATAPTLENLNNLSASEIRKLMIDSGMSESDLAGVEESTLREIFQKALEQANTTE